MHRSARTAHTMRPSRSGSSTIQPATGQAAWQIEHANAPKQRSGSMTAIVFGAFLRGPDIILVHMGSPEAPLPRSCVGGNPMAPLRAVIIADEPGGSADQGTADRRLAIFRHDAPERGVVLVNRVVRVHGEVPNVVRIGRIRCGHKA